MSHLSNARKYLRQLQRQDKKVKKLYLAAASALAMLLVFGLWFFYLGLSLPKAGPIKETGGGEPQKTESTDSFFKTLARGAKKLTQEFIDEFSKFKEKLNQIKEITLEGERFDFTFEEEPLPSTPLP